MGDITTFDNYRLYNEGATVRIADGSFSVVVGIGSVIISRDTRLDFVMFVPKLDYNLLSISKITKDLNCVTKFSKNVCDFQVLNSGKTIGSAKMSAGLYLLRVDAQERQTQEISCVVSRQNKDGAIMLWHYRLGHPNFVYLKKLFPQLFNKNSKDFHC